MIKDLHLLDFIAHKDTRLEFGKGITVFVGHNGSGKSSIIDGITFALFGEHTRRSAKNLVRRGASQGTVQLQFSKSSRDYLATRMVGGSDPRSQLTLVADGGRSLNKPIVGGERRQFGESMSREVAKVLGLDYDRMCVAALVQQGELLRIVNYAPKDFKELLNGLIGIEKLDTAYNTMKEVIGGFRDRLRSETGYTDEEIQKLEKLLVDKEEERKQAESILSEFEQERILLEKKIGELELQVAQMEPMMQRTQDLSSREKLLLRHINESRGAIEGEVLRMERIAGEVKTSLQVIGAREEVVMRLEMVKAESEEIQHKAEQNEGIRGKLRGLLECAGRLQIVDGRCPACNSSVSKLNNMFDTHHIQQEISAREEEKATLQRTKLELKKEEQQLLEQDKRIAFAEKFLRDNSIDSPSELSKLEAELESKKGDFARLPKDISRVGPDPHQLAID
ncbi:MAG: AAA family ATPase, partial [Nitrososphaera sp.]